MGSAPRSLKRARRTELLGHGVSTSAKRDGAQFTGRDVAVVGGGDAAIEEALYLAPLARRVTLIHHRPRLRASGIAVTRLRAHPNVAILTSTELLAVHGGQHVTGVRIRDTRHAGDSTIEVAAVFVAVGQTPCSELLRYFLDLDAGGHIVTERNTTRTSAEGVFAAGDLIRPPLPPSGDRSSERLRGRTGHSALAQPTALSRITFHCHPLSRIEMAPLASKIAR